MARFSQFDGAWRNDADRLKRTLFTESFRRNSEHPSTIYSDLHSVQIIEPAGRTYSKNSACVFQSEDEDSNMIEAYNDEEPNCNILNVEDNHHDEDISEEMKENIENSKTPKRVSYLGKRKYSSCDKGTQTPPSTLSNINPENMDETNYSPKRINVQSELDISQALLTQERSSTLQSVVNIENVYIMPQKSASAEFDLGDSLKPISQFKSSEDENASNAIFNVDDNPNIGSQIEIGSTITNSSELPNKNTHIHSQETVIRSESRTSTSASNNGTKRIVIENSAKMKSTKENSNTGLPASIEILPNRIRPKSSFNQLLESSQMNERISPKRPQAKSLESHFNFTTKNIAGSQLRNNVKDDAFSRLITANKGSATSSPNKEFDRLIDLTQIQEEVKVTELNGLKKFWNIYDTTYRVIRARNARLRPLDLKKLVEFSLRHFVVSDDQKYSLKEHMVYAFASIIELKACGVISVITNQRTGDIIDVKLTDSAKHMFNVTSHQK